MMRQHRHGRLGTTTNQTAVRTKVEPHQLVTRKVHAKSRFLPQPQPRQPQLSQFLFVFVL